MFVVLSPMPLTHRNSGAEDVFVMLQVPASAYHPGVLGGRIQAVSFTCSRPEDEATVTGVGRYSVQGVAVTFARPLVIDPEPLMKGLAA